jgi:hypothetical protein
MKPWAEKAHRIIGRLCLDSYRQSNPKPGRKHVPYVVPALAQDLVDCLNKDDEVRAKCLFLSYEGMKAIEVR